MGTTNTKSIAARIPYDEYINVITRASELRLTTSDYIILKLNDAERLPQLEQELSITQATVIALRNELDKTKNQVSSQEATARGEVASLTKKLGDATANEKLLQKQIADLAASDANWERHALSLSETCDSLEAQHEAETKRLTKHITEQNALLSSQNAEVNRLAAEVVEVKSNMAAAVVRHSADAAVAKALIDRLQTKLAGLIERAETMFEALEKEHDRSPVNYIPKKYWPFLEEFKASLDEKKP